MSKISLDDYKQAYELMDRIVLRCSELEKEHESKVTDRMGYPMWDGAVEGKRAVILIAQADGCRYEDFAGGYVDFPLSEEPDEA